MSAASHPARRLLGAFCSLAGDLWLAGDRADCQPYLGRFAPEELAEVSVSAPAVRASCLAFAAESDAGGAVLYDFRLAAVVIGRRTAAGEPDGAQAARLAGRLGFELGRGQEGPDGRDPWAPACFSAEELDPGRTDSPRWGDIGEPREIRAANLYDPKLRDKRVALWAVTWAQRFRALPSDFALELPVPAGIPAAVLSARAPEIGSAHKAGYETVVPVSREGA